jgi:wyosine [tRNA(Phe)-imidazoG37] synthetase (radical SAM superfamily)
MKHRLLFGPVASRRLGLSLGIDVIPYKTCNMDCVYCECGKTTTLTNDRKEFYPPALINAELDAVLKDSPKLDSITFSGSGEPTLYSGLGSVINHLKKNHPSYRVTVLTNGLLMNRPDVRQDLMQADLVVPSLDAATREVFNRINRPVGPVDTAALIDSLASFKHEFPGKFWLEIFIIPGINDSDEELPALKNASLKIKPDKIHLNSLDRPGTEAWVKQASASDIYRIASFFAPLVVDLILPGKQKVSPGKSSSENPEILETLKRRPSTLNDLSETTGLSAEEINSQLRRLEATGLVRRENGPRGVFYVFVHTTKS